ncbi:hypothetical protein [Treponema sp.]|uniref:hypothetical protein n=1 Tax=Treponema sp. TaxID=166 RepID=UPI00257945C0|nr:hypothetical protein [Treponema sp.]MBE6355070.1 hypothetical protein [Treponema sp.]
MKSSFTKKIITALSLSFLYTAAFASTITDYKISGLKKTKPETLKPYLDTFLNKDSEEIDLHEIETTLRTYGIFSDIKVTLTETEGDENAETDSKTSTLNISLKEKITLLPLPFAFYSSKNYGGGLFILNSNAFGKKDVLAAGGMILSDKIFGMFAYSHAPENNSLGWSLFSSAGKTDHTVTDINDKELNKYYTTGFSFSAGLSESLNSFCTLSQNIGYSYNNFSECDYEDSHNISGSLSFSASFSDWNGYFLLSKSLSLRGGADYSSVNDFSENAAFSLTLQNNFFTSRIRSIIDLKTSYQHGVSIENKNSASDCGLKIISGNFVSTELALARLSLEGAVYKSSAITMSLLGSYEADFAKDYDDSAAICHGPGFGFYVYLEKIALPALGFTYSYNVNKKYSTFNFSLGASF